MRSRGIRLQEPSAGEMLSAADGFNDQATLREGIGLPNLLDCFSCSSSSPALTALISVSMTVGSFSIDGTAIAALPFSNSIRFDPTFTVNRYSPGQFTGVARPGYSAGVGEGGGGQKPK